AHRGLIAAGDVPEAAADRCAAGSLAARAVDWTAGTRGVALAAADRRLVAARQVSVPAADRRSDPNCLIGEAAADRSRRSGRDVYIATADRRGETVSGVGVAAGHRRVAAGDPVVPTGHQPAEARVGLLLAYHQVVGTTVRVAERVLVVPDDQVAPSTDGTA